MVALGCEKAAYLRMDKKPFYALLAFALLTVGCVLVWRDIEAWPHDWLVWRGEWGDQQAVLVLLKQAYQVNDLEEISRWSGKLAPLTERSVVFLEC